MKALVTFVILLLKKRRNSPKKKWKKFRKQGEVFRKMKGRTKRGEEKKNT